MHYLSLVTIAILVVVTFALMATWPFLWIWNFAVVAALTVAKPLTYWRAFWLLVLLASFPGYIATRSTERKKMTMEERLRPLRRHLLR